MTFRRARVRDDGTTALRGMVSLATGTHVGMRRSTNEDSFCALTGPAAPTGVDALLAVADGVGGHQAGEVASEMAVQGLVAKLSDAPATRGKGLRTVLQKAIEGLNADIHSAAAARPETRGMGTTLTASVVSGGSLTIGHVGDSRAYLLRDGAIRQLTQDHSWVAAQVARGKLTASEVENHPHRNMLTRALGINSSVEVDGITVQLKIGDVLLLCTDGLHGLVADEEIAEILCRLEPGSASRELIDLANSRGGHDNITVVLARLDGLTTVRPQ